MPVEVIAHVIPVTQRVLDDHEEQRRIVDRLLRREARLRQLRRWASGGVGIGESFSTPATRDAIARRVHVDSDEWHQILHSEIERVKVATGKRRAYAKTVLERYERVRKAALERREAEERAARAAERKDIPARALTVDRLCAALGISGRFAYHLVQPYCSCSQDPHDAGWDLCAHADDLGIKPWPA